jgi:hypothetical protein
VGGGIFFLNAKIAKVFAKGEKDCWEIMVLSEENEDEG